MSLIVHLLVFLASLGVVWFFAGLLIEAVNRVARRFNQSGFTIAFFVLGILTSISEISVMVNSLINQTPQVSVGNLTGASFVILLFIIPFLAIVGKGVTFKGTLHKRDLILALTTIALPAFLLIDGSVDRSEGLVCVMLYVMLLYLIRDSTKQKLPEVVHKVEEDLIKKRKATTVDVFKIIVGGGFIFLSGHLLVDEAVYFANFLSVPTSIVGLLLLSIGTNVPELVIAVRSILKKRKDIAFGDYLGSALTNTATFGVLALVSGPFGVEAKEFFYTALLMFVGFTIFYFFSKSKANISKHEGIVLILLYGVFVVVQCINLVKFASD